MSHHVPFRLSAEWFCGNSCARIHDVQIEIDDFNKPMLSKLRKERNKSTHK